MSKLENNSIKKIYKQNKQILNLINCKTDKLCEWAWVDPAS